MKSSDVRRKFIEFYKARGHAVIPSASLVPENDPTTLFTSSGMQPLISYLLGQPHPLGKRLVNSQKSFRAQDIDEVGDNRHTTFFEMLGNWSLGDPSASDGIGAGYFKKEQLSWVFSFLVNELGLNPVRLYATIFEGTASVPRDSESEMILRDQYNQMGKEFMNIGDITINKTPYKGMKKTDRIFYYGVEKNWWSRSGTPDKMPTGEPGGPDSEIFYDFGEELNFHNQSIYKNQPCHPNCNCGRFMEIANSVFMEFQKQPDGLVAPLQQRNVDFGGGLERLVAATENTPDVFQTDLFLPIIQKIEEVTHQKYSDNENKPAMRVIADHIKAATFLIVDGVIPSNKERGYIVRRLLRRASVKFAFLRDNPGEYLPPELTTTVLKMYDGIHTVDEKKQRGDVYKVVEEEIRKFQKTLHSGLKVLQKMTLVDGSKAFDLYQTYGFPLEVTTEILKGTGKTVVDVQSYHDEFKKHQELSRTAAKGMFAGGLADKSTEVTKLHTATHLLHEALHRILGDHVEQKGSNITSERLRFDFSHPAKLTAEEIKKIEDLVNQKIKENLPVSFEVMDIDKALASDARAFFSERYGEKVKVYTIGEFSREICGGPHVSFTGEIGHFTIVKEESAGAGIRRLYASVHPYEDSLTRPKRLSP